MDGNNLLHRAFHGLHSPLTAPGGSDVRAVFGFAKTLGKFFADVSPDFAAVAFDPPGPTFRHLMDDAYKATRQSAPPELAGQFSIARELLAAMGIPAVSAPGYEADDMLGSLAASLAAAGYSVAVVSGDRDLLQIISENISVLQPKNHGDPVEYTAESFERAYGVAPAQYIDVKALMGDASDNIRGARGIGEKTAFSLIKKYGSIENALAHAGDLKSAARKALTEDADIALSNRKLVTIVTDAPHGVDVSRLPRVTRETIYNDSSRAMFERLGFRSMMALFGGQAEDSPPEDEYGPDGSLKATDDLKALIKQCRRDGVEPPEGVFDRSVARYLTGVRGGGYAELNAALAETGMDRLYYDVELPLVPILADMEEAGVLADGAALEAFGEELRISTEALQAEIYGLTGETFNISSPKQLGEVLFGKLALKGGRKTKNGYSTDQDALERLIGKHPAIPRIMEFRKLSKLKSSYAVGLLSAIGPDGRIRTTFSQTAAATGRLSSQNPNLQSVPVRGRVGARFRETFIAEPGNLLIDADYNQIELRVLAHLSGDDALIEAFRSGADIHRLTASQVFLTPYDEVTREQRSAAKAVNFGIVYGKSAFSLSRDLDITVIEAARYIEGYFARYPKVRAFLDSLAEAARELGYVTTLMGRRREIPEINASKHNERASGERAAMNTPIQGSAADIIKTAMIRVAGRLKREGVETRLLLQIHDELLLESPESEAERAAAVVKEEMEGAASLLAPLSVEVGIGGTWAEAH